MTRAHMLMLSYLRRVGHLLPSMAFVSLACSVIWYSWGGAWCAISFNLEQIIRLSPILMLLSLLHLQSNTGLMLLLLHLSLLVSSDGSPVVTVQLGIKIGLCLAVRSLRLLLHVMIF